MKVFSVARRRLGWRLCAGLAVALGLACGSDEHQRLADARSAMAKADWADAVAAADAGLASAADPQVSWGLELVKLEAHARAGDAEPAVEQLARLTRLYPERVPPTQYSATADQLRSAGQSAAAIEVLDMGFKRFPSDPTLERLIGDASAGAGSGEVDSSELEMLRSLGYVD
jgi:predicted Zn-dependent protease